MRNTLKRVGFIVFIAVIGLFVFAGCTTTDASLTWGREGTFPSVDVAAKDFTTVGLVFAETQVERTRRRESVTVSGELITYNALLREAQALGADAIVNVIIDIKHNYSGRKTKFLFFTLEDTGVHHDVWQGSALAISYGNKLVQNDIVSRGTSSGGGRSGGDSDGLFSSGSGKVWWNPFTWFN